MQVWQSHWQGGPPPVPDTFAATDVDLLMIHGGMIGKADFSALKEAYPKAKIAGCSGAGEIMDASMSEEGAVISAIKMEKATVQVGSIALEDGEDSADAGARVVATLPADGLTHVMVYSDGLRVNGTALVDGMTRALPKGVIVTGGLAGDGARFEKTHVFTQDGPIDGGIVAVGFYGDIKVGYGSMGGWDPFGPQRRITKSKDNVLYELDGRPALELYKEYLGEHAAGLPATGLLFPLLLPDEDGGQGVVRTILGVDEEAKTMTFAGDVPTGAAAQLMKANFDRLVDGAQTAANRSNVAMNGGAELAVLISCVGRKLVLKQRVEDELDAVREVIGPKAAMAGFYSYGEICPAAPDADCRLHNQTMTITTFSEA